MKHILIIIALMSVQLLTAQVNMKLFNQDQVWIFSGKTVEDMQGIVLAVNQKCYEYKNYNHKAMAVESINSIFYDSYTLDVQKQLIYFNRSNYAYAIKKATDKFLVLERSAKRFRNDFIDFEDRYPKRMFFYRLEKKINLPIYEEDNGDGDIMPLLGKIKINY